MFWARGASFLSIFRPKKLVFRVFGVPNSQTRGFGDAPGCWNGPSGRVERYFPSLRLETARVPSVESVKPVRGAPP